MRFHWTLIGFEIAVRIESPGARPALSDRTAHG
jgi:hypothetical protein